MNNTGIIVIGTILALAFTQCKSPEETSSSNEQKPPQNSNRGNGGPPNTNEMFVKMDSNKDGKLSLEEVKGPLKNDFSKIDTDGDGFLSKKEIEAAPKPNGGQRPPR